MNFRQINKQPRIDSKRPSIHAQTGIGLLTVILIMATGSMASGAVVSYQNGVDGYMGTMDTMLVPSVTDPSVYGPGPYIYTYSTVDGLIRFNDIFGAGPNLIAPGSFIISATLEVTQLTSLDQDGRVDLHRMIADWSDLDTYDSMVNGIQTDGVEAAVAATASTIATTFDVTADVQAWSDGTPNRGWATQLSASSPSNHYFYSSDYSASVSVRPILTIETEGVVPTVEGSWGSVKALFR
jgi:hypothetical protein